MADNVNISKNGITRRDFMKYTAGTVVLLSAGSLLTSCGSSGKNASDTPKIVFSSLHYVGDHPVVEQLKKLEVTVKEYISDEHHGLVLDGARISAAEVAASTVIREYLRGEKTLLLLNCSGDHKQALVQHIGIAFGNDASHAYCIVPVAGSQARHMTILDHPRANVIDITDLTSAGIEVDEAFFQSSQDDFINDIENVSGPKAYAASIRDELDANLKQRPTALLKAELAVLATDSGSQGLPQELKNMKWIFKPDAHWKYFNMTPGGDPTPYIYPAKAPNQGFQAGAVSATITVQLYLDNSNQNAHFQWLTVDHQGAADPLTSHSDYVAGKSVAMPRDGQQFTYTYNDPQNGPAEVAAKSWGYAQMAYVFAFSPAFSNPAETLHFFTASPPNKNDVTSYDSGYNFDVGFSKEGVDATFTIEHSTQTEIADWSCDNKTNIETFDYKWEWHSSNPENTTSFEKMNKLNSKLLFQPSSSCVMQTKSLQTDTRTFTMNCGVSQISMNSKCVFAPDATIHWKYYNDRKDIGSCICYSDYPVTIDFNSVLYPVLQSLISVQNGSSAAVTVVLDTYAPVGGTLVYLFSTDPGLASVPATITVPENMAQQIIPITTGSVLGSVVIKASLINEISSAPVSCILNLT
ncbi:MAG: twin-arginine translocation signal domain-containing protein [Deltaproteobacteria bacterium]|nr:twin-arginine translocation signal domain-containing protein [Deltaproteobacteria bacterium]